MGLGKVLLTRQVGIGAVHSAATVAWPWAPRAAWVVRWEGVLTWQRREEPPAPYPKQLI